MNVFAMENADVTLAAALEFIDSFEEPELVLDPSPLSFAAAAPHSPFGSGTSSETTGDESTGASDEFYSRTSSGSDGSPARCSSSQTSRGLSKRQKKSTALASKRLRERKKKEMAALVEEAADLETRLAHLHQRAISTATTKAASTLDRRLGSDAQFVAHVAAAVRASVAAVSNRRDVTSWFDVAADEARERRESEALNVELRRALEDQARLADSLRGLVQGHSAGRVGSSVLRIR